MNRLLDIGSRLAPRALYCVELFTCALSTTYYECHRGSVNRRDQLSGEYEVGYQQEGRPDQSAGPEGAHEGLDDPSVHTG